jgi:hypothetical protein
MQIGRTEEREWLSVNEVERGVFGRQQCRVYTTVTSNLTRGRIEPDIKEVRHMQQRLWVGGIVMVVVLGVGGLVLPYGASAGERDGKIKGLAAGVPGGSITVPLPDGVAPVEFQVTFGSPSISFPVILTSATDVDVEEGPSILSNGDAVEVEGSINAEGKLLLDELELEDFLELEIDGLIVDIPTVDNTLTLPLAPGSPSVTVLFSLVVSGATFPMVITPATQVEGSTSTLVLNEGDRVEFEAVFRDGEIRVQKIEEED